MSYYCGVDPGRKGGIAMLSGDGMIARVWDMPEESERGMDLVTLMGIMQHIPPITPVVIEWNTARPGEVPDFAFRFGLQTGQLDAAFKCLGYNVAHVSPQTWKAKLGLPGKADDPTSQQGLAYLLRKYPQHEHLVIGPRGGIQDGPLDALLLAEYYRMYIVSPVGNKGGRRPPTFRGVPQEELDKALKML